MEKKKILLIVGILLLLPLLFYIRVRLDIFGPEGSKFCEAHDLPWPIALEMESGHGQLTCSSCNPSLPPDFRIECEQKEFNIRRNFLRIIKADG